MISLDDSKWKDSNPSDTYVELYDKTFNSIEEFESSFNDELQVIKGILS